MGTPAYPDQKRRIAVVDDDRLFTKVVEATLKQKGGHKVLVINNPEDAILAIKGFQPDIILLDIIMPKLDGARLHFMLEQDTELREIPVIIVSGLVTKRGQVQQRPVNVENGPPSVLRLGKPLHPEALIHAVELEIGRHEAHHQMVTSESDVSARHSYPITNDDVLHSRITRPGLDDGGLN